MGAPRCGAWRIRHSEKRVESVEMCRIVSNWNRWTAPFFETVARCNTRFSDLPRKMRQPIS
jgi:hypothetical protein